MTDIIQASKELSVSSESDSIVSMVTVGNSLLESVGLSSMTPPPKRRQLISVTQTGSPSMEYEDTNSYYCVSPSSSSKGDSDDCADVEMDTTSCSELFIPVQRQFRNATGTTFLRIFSEDEERLLEEILMSLSVIYIGLTVEQVRNYTFWFMKTRNVQILQKWDTQEKISSRWLISFLKRHKLLNSLIRKHRNEVLCLNEEIYDEFCQIRDYIERGFCSNPCNIYSLDELIFTVGADNITAFFCINAIGHSMPPFLVYPRDKVPTTDGIEAYATADGSVDCKLFIKVLDHFQKYMRGTPDEPVLVVLDSHETHSSLETLQYGVERGLKFLYLPAHGSRVVQPLTYVFESLKSTLEPACCTYASLITISDIPVLLNLAYPLAFTIPNIVDAFELSEIWTKNAHFIKRNDFLENHRAFADQHPVINVSEFANPPAREIFDSNEVDRYFGQLETFYRENKTSKREYSGPKQYVAYTNDTRGILYTVGITTLATVNVVNEWRVTVDPAVADNEIDSGENVVTLCCYKNETQSSSFTFLIFPDIGYDFGIDANTCDLAVKTSSDGRLNNQLCTAILEHLKRRAEASPDKPILLTLDSETFPVTSRVRRFCDANGINLLPVPAGTARKLIPYNKSIFESVKFGFRRECETVLVNNGVINFDDIRSAYCKVRDMNNKSGFKSTGIYPLNRDALALEYPTIPSIIVSPYDEDITVDFYRNLTVAYEQLEVNGGLSPHKIYVLGVVDLYAAHDSICTEMETAEACFCVNALGHVLPPYLVFHRSKFESHFVLEGPQGTAGTSSEEGPRCEHVFLDMLSHFQKFVKGTPSNQILLIVDERTCCITDSTNNFCREHGLILLVVPAAVTKVILPLERTVFKSFKFYYDRAYSDYITSKLILVQYLDRPNCRYPHNVNIASLLNRAFRLSFLTSSIIKGFECTGIWPKRQ